MGEVVWWGIWTDDVPWLSSTGADEPRVREYSKVDEKELTSRVAKMAWMSRLGEEATVDKNCRVPL